MKWVFPEFLWALSALAIPIVIHLFNFRRFQKVLFTRVAWLQKVQLQTKTGNKLKKILIMITRMLVVFFLVLAFAQPYWQNKTNKSQKESSAVTIYIDNSFSMELQGEEGIALESAKEKARMLVNAMRITDKVQVMTNEDNDATAFFSTPQDAIEIIDGIKVSPSVRKTESIIALQNKSLFERSEPVKKAYLITDFQKSNYPKPVNISYDTTISATWMAVASAEFPNLSLDTCWLSSPVTRPYEPVEITFQITNHSSTDAESVPVELVLNKVKKGMANITIPAGKTERGTLVFTPTEKGLQEAELLTVSDGLSFDDKLFFSFKVSDSLNVLAITETSDRYFAAVFKAEPSFIYKEQSPSAVNYSGFSSQNLIILNSLSNISTGLAEELKKFVYKGGSIMLIPGIDAQSLNSLCGVLGISTYGNMVEQNIRVSKIETEHPVFQGLFEKVRPNMDLPVVNKYFRLTNGTQPGKSTLLQLANGDPFIELYSVGRGLVYQAATPFDQAFTNIRAHSVFALIMLRAGLYRKTNKLLYAEAGTSDWLTLEQGNYSPGTTYELSNREATLIPEMIFRNNTTEINLNEEIKQAGIYKLSEKNNNKVLELLAFNYSRTESGTEYLSKENIEEMAENVGAVSNFESGTYLEKMINDAENGTPLWKWCVILSLLFLAVEILLIRFFNPKPIAK